MHTQLYSFLSAVLFFLANDHIERLCDGRDRCILPGWMKKSTTDGRLKNRQFKNAPSICLMVSTALLRKIRVSLVHQIYQQILYTLFYTAWIHWENSWRMKTNLWPTLEKLEESLLLIYEIIENGCVMVLQRDVDCTSWHTAYRISDSLIVSLCIPTLHNKPA